MNGVKPGRKTMIILLPTEKVTRGAFKHYPLKLHCFSYQVGRYADFQGPG